MWLSSRVIIWTAMLLLAPLLTAPPGGITPAFGWKVFDTWDSIHYRAIATSGYEYADDEQQHNLAFFPLFPWIVRELMGLGIPFEVAGILVNNIAFLATLYFLYFWVAQHHGNSTARWTTAVMAWFPMSLFGSVIYTEGLYLLSSTATLQAFDSKQYYRTALWGAIATATRPTGIALLIALFVAAIKQRRGVSAYIASLIAASGIVLFSLFCALRFHDPLAFIHAQKGWRPSFGFAWQSWLDMVMEITIGTTNWALLSIVNYIHLLLFTIFVLTGYLFWRFRAQLASVKVIYSFGALVLFLSLLADDWLIYNLLNAGTILGGSYVLWRVRNELTTVTFTYGFCGIALLLASGGTISLSRLTYGIVSLSIALGVLLDRHPRWGCMIHGLFAILLTRLAVRFAQQLWIG